MHVCVICCVSHVCVGVFVTENKGHVILPLAVYLFVGVGCVIMCDLGPYNTLKSDSLYVQKSGGKY